MKIATMIKNGIIAFCLFVAAIITAFLFGIRKQQKKNVRDAESVVAKELDKISGVRRDVEKRLPDNPDSIDDQLRDRWTRD